MYGQFTEDNKSKFNEMYSSVQWFTALDKLIYSAIDVLLQRTTYVQEHISTLINYQLTYKRRGVSTQLNWQETISALIKVLQTGSIEDYKAIHIDRGFSIHIINSFLSVTEDYTQNVISGFKFAFSLDLCYYHKISCAKTDDLLGVIQHVEFCQKNIARLKHLLLSYYILYIEKTANYDSQQSKFVTDAEEVKQNYFLAFNKAVDHFNVAKGAFKSYLDIWITKYRNHHTNYYGTAFVVPSGSGVYSMSSELDMEALAEDENYMCSSSIDVVNNESELEFLKALARLVDPDEYTFGFLGLNEDT